MFAPLIRPRTLICHAGAVAALASAALGNARYDAWQLDHPFTQTAWATHEGSSTPHHFETEFLYNAGLNAGWDGRNSASSSHLHPNSLGYSTFMMSYQADPTTTSQFNAARTAAIADFNAASANHTNLVGMILGDEVEQVFPTGGLQHQRNVRDWLVANHPNLLTISSVPALQDAYDTPYVQSTYENTFNTVQPDVMLAQHYPYAGVGLDASYYKDLQWYNDWTRSKNVGMWVYPQAYASSAQGTPSESELRHQRFTSLAYGVKGFSDFLYVSNPNVTVAGTGYNFDGGLTTMGAQLTPINKEIANISKSLVGLTHARTYHMDAEAGVYGFAASDNDLPVNLRRTGKLTGATSTNGNKLEVGFFRDSAGSEYFMLVNKNAAEGATGASLATNVTMNFDLSKLDPNRHAVRRLNRTTGVIETIPVTSGSHTFNLTGGTGDLFTYAGKPMYIQRQPIQPRVLVYDDFEQYSTATLPEVVTVIDNDYTYSPTGLAAEYGATAGPAIVYEPLESGAGDSGSSSGSNGLTNHPSGGLRGVDRPFPYGAITGGLLTLEADLSLSIPLRDLGSSNHANLILGEAPDGGGTTPRINFEAGENGTIQVQAGTLGGSFANTIPLVTNSTGTDFHFKIEVDLESQSFIASITGDATGSTGVLNYNNAFAPDVFSLTAGRYWGSHTTWDNLKLVWLAPEGPVGDIDNNGGYSGHDIDLLREAINAATNFQYYDVNDDTLVNTADFNHLLGDVLNTTLGDTDLDGDVDLNDLGNLATNYGGSMNVGWAKGDFDGDGDVDLNDLGTLATFYGAGSAQAFADFQALSIPEPSSAAMLLGVLALLGNRTRRGMQ